jgi:hypothetical protein
VSTADFRRLAEEFLPRNTPERDLENFFDQWVYGTGIPSLNLTHSSKGKPPAVRFSATVTASGLPPGLTATVPVRLEWPKRPPVEHWVRVDAEGGELQLKLPQAPARVLLNPANSVLAVKR